MAARLKRGEKELGRDIFGSKWVFGCRGTGNFDCDGNGVEEARALQQMQVNLQFTTDATVIQSTDGCQKTTALAVACSHPPACGYAYIHACPLRLLTAGAEDVDAAFARDDGGHHHTAQSTLGDDLKFQ